MAKTLSQIANISILSPFLAPEIIKALQKHLYLVKEVLRGHMWEWVKNWLKN